MKLAGLSAVDYSTLSDSALDQAYSDAFNVGDSPTYTAAGDQIVIRLATPTGAIEALFGKHEFPLWDAIQASGKTTAGFVATDVAQQAVLTSSGNLIDSVKSWGSIGGVLLIGAALMVVVLKFHPRK